jgi:hypothetical protein
MSALLSYKMSIYLFIYVSVGLTYMHLTEALDYVELPNFTLTVLLLLWQIDVRYLTFEFVCRQILYL